MSESTTNLGDGRVLTATCDPIEVTSLGDRPDPAWTVTDVLGHVHAYNSAVKGYPTLSWVVDEEDYTVVEDGYLEEYPGSGHYECRHCGEPINPGRLGPSIFREFIPGPRHYYLDGEPISEEQYRLITAEIASR